MPTLVFRKALLASVIGSTLAITGCGSSDEKNTEKLTLPAKNKVPVVSISGEAQALEQAAFKLMATATDSDGAIASYEWTYSSDMELNVEGTNSAELKVTSGNISEDKAVTFTLKVTDDQGATATVQKAVVIKRKVSTVTITGIVTDKPIANANLTIFAGNSSVSTLADETGHYTARFSVDESEADKLVQIRATGLGSQDNVEFVSQLNSMNKLVEQAGSDGKLDSSENFGVNITNVTTAEFALLSRSTQPFSTDEQLQQALLNVDAAEKLKLAALIKIVVDNDDYNLPEGIQTTLDLVDDAASAAQFEAEVNSRDPGLIEKTEEEIKKDKNLVSGITGSLIGEFIIHNPQFVTSSAYHLTLAENGKGSIAAVNQVSIKNWTNNDGTVQIELEQPLIISQSKTNKLDANNYPMYDEQNNPIMETIVYQTTKLNLQVLADNGVFRTIDFVTNSEKYIDGQLDLNEKPNTAIYASNLLDKTKTLNVGKNDLVATWYLDVYERNYFNENAPVERLVFNEDGTIVTSDSTKTMTWSLANNILTLNYTDGDYKGSTSYWITKSLGAGYQFVSLENGKINQDGSVSTNDVHAKAQWGWLFKQDLNLTMTKDNVIGRWTGFIGFNQANFDMIVEEDLNVKFGISESSNDGRFADGVFYREFYIEDNKIVRFCDTSQSNCRLGNRFVYKFIAVKDDHYFIERTNVNANGEAYNSSLQIYKYTPELAYSEFTEGLLASLNSTENNTQSFYTYDSNGQLVEATFKFEEVWSDNNSQFVSQLRIGDNTYAFSLVDGKLMYNTPTGLYIVELIELNEQGLTLCTYPQGQTCTEANKSTLSFNLPHIGEFFINNPELFHSSTYKINLGQTRYSKSASVKLPGLLAEHTTDWYLDNGAIVLPIHAQESINEYTVDGQQVREETYLADVKLKIARNGDVEVEESRSIYRDYSYVRTDVNQYSAKKLTSSNFNSIETSDLVGTWVIHDNNVVNHLGQGNYTFATNGTGTAKLGVFNGVADSSDFTWSLVDGSLNIAHADGVRHEQFFFTKDLRIDGYQAVVMRAENDSNWVSSSLLVKDKGVLPYTKSDYVGRWLQRNGEDVVKENDFGIEIYDGLEVRFGTTLSSTQGESVEDGIFTRTRYVNPLDNNRLVAPCDVQLDTCALNVKVVHKPIAKDGNRTYFSRSWDSYYNGELRYTNQMLYVIDKADTMGIPQLNDQMLHFDLQNPANKEFWSSRGVFAGQQTTYSLQIDGSEPLPYTFANGKINIRMPNGYVYNIELVPGSNTKDGITVCKYFASDTCEQGEQIRLNYPPLYQ